MKRLIFFLTFIIGALLIFSACVNETSEGVSYPFGSIAEVTSDGDSSPIEVPVNEQVTYVDVDSTTLGANLTINLDVSDEIDKGGVIYVEATADDTNRDITWGTGFTATAETVTATKTSMYTFVYTGSSFNIISADQID